MSTTCRIRWLALPAWLALLALPVLPAAQPSYDCADASTESERTICADAWLAELDLRMAQLFRLQRAEAEAAGDRREVARLDASIPAWLPWRDFCGDDRACLTRRYHERIADLDPSAAPQPPGVGAAAWIDGKIAIPLADGRWRVVSRGGCESIVERPADAPTCLFVDVGRLDFPPLGGQAAWAEEVENELLTVIDRYFAPADRAAYRAATASLPLSRRLFEHARAVDTLTK